MITVTEDMRRIAREFLGFNPNETMQDIEERWVAVYRAMRALEPVTAPQTIENEADKLWDALEKSADPVAIITQALLKARREAMDSVIEWHVLAAKVKRDLAEKMFNPEKPFQIVHCPEAEIHEQCAAYFRNLKERS